jgi:glycosyltransferase involved in cell wall biosynthesis
MSRKSIVINTNHTAWHPLHRKAMDSSTAWLASAFITFSPRAEEVFTKRGPFGRPVRHIPYGIEIPPRKGADVSALRDRLQLPLDRFIWIAVGSLTRPKAFQDLIVAFARVIKKDRRALLIIAGEGEERPRLEKLIGDLGMGDLIRLQGIRMDVADLLAASDAFVLSSHREGNPLALLEAMAASLPAVVTRVGIVPTMAVDVETAIIVEPNRPEALAEAMVRLMGLGEISRSMGEAGRSRLELYFDFRRTQREVERFYDDLTDQAQPGHWR